MRCPQYGKWHKGHRRANNAAMPLAAMVRGKYGKLQKLDLTAKRPVIGRADPPRDKAASRNDNRHYFSSRTPDNLWPHRVTGQFKVLRAPFRSASSGGRKA